MGKRVNNSRTASGFTVRRESGVVLFIALIAMVVMTMAALTLIRSSGTATTIAGNLSFQQAATQAADAGIELAYQALPAIANREANVANQYFSLQQAVDANGVPTSIIWASVPCYDGLDPARPVMSNCTDESTYRVQYVIDRQCIGLLPADIEKSCLTKSEDDQGSRAAGSTRFKSVPEVLYRVTIRVLGPRGTTSMVQAVLAL